MRSLPLEQQDDRGGDMIGFLRQKNKNLPTTSLLFQTGDASFRMIWALERILPLREATTTGEE
jgi:hypothetical protein